MRTFICEYCGYRLATMATQTWHICPKNNKEDTELVRLDTAVPVDILCDGCDAGRLGITNHVYSDKVARHAARKAGWECDKKTGDWCPRCAADRKVIAT